MYNVSIQLPDVDWSTVPGPRSRGYDRKREEDAIEVTQKLVEILSEMKMDGFLVVGRLAGEELWRHLIVSQEDSNGNTKS